MDPTNESDATGAAGAAGANLFLPPNVLRNDNDPAGVNITPQTAQRRRVPGGLSALLQNLFQGVTADPQVPGQPAPQPDPDPL